MFLLRLLTLGCCALVVIAPAHAGKKPKKSTPPAAAKTSDAAAKAAPAEEAAAGAPVSALAIAPPPLPTKYRAVALLPLIVEGVPDEVVVALRQALLTEIDEQDGMKSIAPADVVSELATVGLDPSACEGETTCLAQAGRYARAHLALDARLAYVGGTLSVSMRLVDTEKAVETTRVADLLPEVEADRASHLHRMAVQLLSPAAYVGVLVLQIAEPGADVYLNDQLVGTTPLSGPLTGLAAGPSILRVSKQGFADLYQFVDVAYRRTTTLTVDLSSTTISGVIVEQESATGFGSLFVLSNQAGVEIRVDGEPKGLTPIGGALTDVPAGKRRLSLRKPGLEPVVQEIDIEKGMRTDVGVDASGSKIVFASFRVVVPATPLPDNITLEDSLELVNPGVSVAGAPQTRGPSTWFYTGLGTAGAGLVAAAVGGYFSMKIVGLNNDGEALQKKVDDGTFEGDARAEGDRLDADGEAAERNQWRAYGAAAGLLVVGGALMGWDMLTWDEPVSAGTTNVDSGPGAPGQPPGRSPGQYTLRVLPLPSGAAALFDFRF